MRTSNQVRASDGQRTCRPIQLIAVSPLTTQYRARVPRVATPNFEAAKSSGHLYRGNWRHGVANGL